MDRVDPDGAPALGLLRGQFYNAKGDGKFMHVSPAVPRWYSTARVSTRLLYEAAACLRARYCTDDFRNERLDKGNRFINGRPDRFTQTHSLFVVAGRRRL